jgi:predicted xylan-binding protein with Ca-dependent carbohydrate-binding module
VLDLSLSEDAWKGDAQFTVSVDGKQVGGTMTAHALASSGASEHLKLTGNWGSGALSVGITFLNDAWGGTSATDRNLHVDAVAYDGVKYANTRSVLYRNEAQSFKVGGSAATAPSDKNPLTLHLSEDAYQGDAKVQISVDGKTITSPEVVKALHSAGALQDFTFTGLGSGSHDIGVTFLNDAYGDSPSTDRNLYVGSIDYGSHHFATDATFLFGGTQHFTVS